MNNIYMDNASTTFPKPGVVADKVAEFISKNGFNINRGTYEGAYGVEEIVYDTRKKIAELFNCNNCRNVIFTMNVTMALNMVIKGLLKPGDHILVSAMEHNAVMRPVIQLSKTGVAFDRIPCDRQGNLCMGDMEKLIRPDTRAVIMTHASNVCGTVMPIKEVGEICKAHNLFFIVDGAQTCGILPVDMKECNIDALCFTGHKGMMGPQGIGGFIINDRLVKEVNPIISGGTGSISHTEEVPDFLPDKYEAGTPNLPGIVGLNASISYIMEYGIDRIYEHELYLTGLFLEGIKDVHNIRILGKHNCEKRMGVVGVSFINLDNAQAAYELENKYHILTRVGLHCAPNAHITLESYPKGCVRFSFGLYNTADEVQKAIEAVKHIAGGN